MILLARHTQLTGAMYGTRRRIFSSRCCCVWFGLRVTENVHVVRACCVLIGCCSATVRRSANHTRRMSALAGGLAGYGMAGEERSPRTGRAKFA
ncbi:hypothetical protein BU26DRAFT_104666 [Trematosphaeria pertusa]|uniref:Uncharacterized protein n=1 Tax=Trematosphaeria pertusa TaxID=390896 RepID=A0A6A6I0Z3_9PLEO|nr:uncharacterized protein BU26DRAFT_104666 [Trematosphaeria pertusa]KAF2243573.1 hypothetical protein BU26DRAFT_104666 [Trematosphaeria pertusa]